MFGREPRLPTDILMGSMKDIAHDVAQYSLKATLDLRNAYDIVRKKIEENAKSMKLHWDKNIKNRKVFEEGDKVLSFLPKINNVAGEPDKAHVFKSDWSGPHTVIKKPHLNNSDVYILKDEKGRTWTSNANKLYKFAERQFLSAEPVEQKRAPTKRDSNLSLFRYILLRN